MSAIHVRNGAAVFRKAMATIVGLPHITKTRILVADEHPLFRLGIMDFINRQADMVVCGQADSIPSLQAKLAESKPHLIVLGLRLGNGDTLHFIKGLRVQYPEVLMLVFSQFEEALFAERTLRAGANGYLMKRAAKEEVLAAIRDIVRGQGYVSRDIAMRAFAKSLEIPPQNRPQENTVHIETLSDREMHVFQLIGSGLSTKKIAEVLNLSVKTIESHRENIKHKLGLNRGTELIEGANKWVEEILLANQKEPAPCGREKENGARPRRHHESRRKSLQFF